jgi:hypothetical protein
MRSDVETPPEVWGSGRGSGSTSGSAYYQICNKCGAQLNAEGKCPKGCNSGSGSSGNTSGSGVRKCPVCQSQLINTTYCLQCGWKAYGSGSGSGNGNNSSGGGDGNGNNNNNNNNETEPEVRTDCTEKAAQNSQSAHNALNANTSIKTKTDTLRNYAQNQTSREYGMVINKDSGGYNSSEVIPGTKGSIELPIGANTVYSVHIHNNSEAGTVLTGPSFSDVLTTISYGYKYDNDEGSVILTHDGSEYLIYIDDKDIAREFWDSDDRGHVDLDENNKLKDDFGKRVYKDMHENLLKQGYSKDDAHIYALSAFFDYWETGIKISVKEDGDTTFRETKTDKQYITETTYNYIPSVCPGN